MVQRAFSTTGQTSPSMALWRVLPESRDTTSHSSSAWASTWSSNNPITLRRSSKDVLAHSVCALRALCTRPGRLSGGVTCTLPRGLRVAGS
ncbi:MAG: hypothetical protein QM778_37730 [Myxococcales bacterium]